MKSKRVKANSDKAGANSSKNDKSDVDKNNDFGGIPNLDLKKSLGCG